MKIQALLFCCAILSCRVQADTRIQRLIEEVKEEMELDKREVLFDVIVEETGEKPVLKGEISDPLCYQELQKALKANRVAYTDSIQQLPAPQLGEKVWGLVSVPVANIYVTASSAQEQSTQAVLGNPVKLLKKDGDFYYVQTADNYLGWLDKESVIAFENIAFRKWQTNPRIVSTALFSFVYKLPSHKAMATCEMPQGSFFVLVGEEENYYKVKLPDGGEGFVKKTETQLYEEWKDQAVQATNLVATAKQYLGMPYLWGGTSSKGVDCSGFTRSIYFANGVLLARDASLQIKDGVAVSKEDLQLGDLVFFGEDKASHVGMYIGNEEYIHASGSVKINSLNANSPHFDTEGTHNYLGARRIINSLDRNGIVLVGNHIWYNFYE